VLDVVVGDVEVDGDDVVDVRRRRGRCRGRHGEWGRGMARWRKEPEGRSTNWAVIYGPKFPLGQVIGK
jgi:hypothetical protein